MEKRKYTYYDERGFSMQYPEGWLRQNIQQALIFVSLAQNEQAVTSQDSLTVFCQELIEGTTLAIYTERNLTQNK